MTHTRMLSKAGSKIARKIVPKDEWLGFVLCEVWEGYDELVKQYPGYMKQVIDEIDKINKENGFGIGG